MVVVIAGSARNIFGVLVVVVAAVIVAGSARNIFGVVVVVVIAGSVRYILVTIVVVVAGSAQNIFGVVVVVVFVVLQLPGFGAHKIYWLLLLLL